MQMGKNISFLSFIIVTTDTAKQTYITLNKGKIRTYLVIVT